jgi:hypothetical protein
VESFLKNIIQYMKVEAFRHPSIIFGYQLESNTIIWHFLGEFFLSLKNLKNTSFSLLVF